MADTINLLTDKFNFKLSLKTLPLKGNLVYEYNPFRNYRLNESMVYYKNTLFTFKEFCEEINWKGTVDEFKKYIEENNITSWSEFNIPKNVELPIVYLKGLLVDFETDELNFSLNNPVNITPQWSYDNSVNLVINDGLNPPRLINSRFSCIGRNKYLINDRKGNNDTNIYDRGEQFDIDTSLYKKINTIPRLEFSGVSYGGNMTIGNYHFYFRYVDEDGNESDFFAESGLVSLFIGNTADSIHSGFRNEQCYKQVKFTLSNTDPGYSKVRIYYTKSTSDVQENAVVNAYKIDLNYLLSNNGSTLLVITGYEPTIQVDMSEINPVYLIYGSAATLDTVLNMLFLANVDKPKTEYTDLADCALRFLPVLDVSEQYNVDLIGRDYRGNVNNTYYDPDYIYNKVGYWDDEIYRFGIVFIKKDNTLTEVFNVRGNKLSTSKLTDYSEGAFMDEEGNRTYLNYDELNFAIISTNKEDPQLTKKINIFENAKGVIHIDAPGYKNVIGINFKVAKEVVDYLQDTLGIKGYFFVRLKRIPTTLCQAYTIGIDKESHLPVIPTERDENKIITTGIIETFLTLHSDLSKAITGDDDEEENERILDHNIDNRLYKLESSYFKPQAAICPDYDVNSPYLNTLFSGGDLVCRPSTDGNLLTQNDLQLSLTKNEFTKTNNYDTVKIIGVEDNVKLVGIGNNLFSARGGEAEEAFRYEYAGRKNINKYCTNLVRGSYGPYIGITGLKDNMYGYLLDIKIPGYKAGSMSDYFTIRYNDKSGYYAVSDRFSLQDTLRWREENENYYLLRTPVYRGDCYICQFTHRLNRNFQDPSSPTNDLIVDPDCWKDNFDISDGVVKKENFEAINLGDVNAVRMGLYITLTVRSTMNLNIRAMDGSYTDESAMFGHNRGFYPMLSMTNKGSYKIPEALCYNKGFEKSLSERVNFEVADVPWIKNEFSNRIAYSNIQVLDAFQNGWRTFVGMHYRDYPKTYGSITKIVELRGYLLCVFEHGVGLISVNERALAAEGAGGNVYINTSNVLPENPKILSDTFGSQWRDSIIKTPTAIYGVDTVAKKIWRTNGSEFECISDFKIQEFLNNNITLTEKELDPIIGIRNVKTHYNKFKHDVMFTFYDNLHGFEEKVWNLCYNEILDTWVTFYSWVPSYSENISNQFFSFDRNTSKWIAKLGVSKHDNDFSDGVTLSENIIPNSTKSGAKIGELYLDNRTLPSGQNVTVNIKYSLEHDNYGNYKLFEIKKEEVEETDKETNEKKIVTKWYLCLKTDATNLCSELYVRVSKNEKGEIQKTITDLSDLSQKQDWINNCILNNEYYIYKDDRGCRKNLDNKYNWNKIVILLNIKADIEVSYAGAASSIVEAYQQGFNNNMKVDAGYYKSVVAVIPKYNMQFLTTDFWKHGQAGIIDIADKIYPTYWYGKLHPFEFEFVVADKPENHKIFDNLEIISNSAEPESFHYEIIGDCYDFAKDKKNMYIRQEATKELYLYNGSDITYDHDYLDLESVHRPIDASIKLYDKSTLLPLYYSRLDSINEVEDSYHLKDGGSTKDFSALSGGEIVRYEDLDEYRIWNHAKAINLQDKGRLRGNMQYREDKWLVLINPLNIVLLNEDEWKDLLGNSTEKIPVELKQNPLPSDILDPTAIDVPDSFENRGYVIWNWEESQMREAKLKDKWIKIRIRYTGDKLAIISAVKTLYSISY